MTSKEEILRLDGEARYGDLIAELNRPGAKSGLSRGPAEDHGSARNAHSTLSLTKAGGGVTSSEAGARQLCTFFLHDCFFGVDVTQVQEVIRYQEMTRVPLAPPAVAGLINLRGQIVTAIDLRRRLGLPARSADARPMNVVVRTDDGAVSLLVDEIADVVEVREDAFAPAPATLSATKDLIRGVYRLKPRLLMLLDTERAVTLSGLESAI